MTTNVADLSNKILASDSRWSVERPNFILFVDDTDFDKVVLCGSGDLSLIFAGNGNLIQVWKDWLIQPIKVKPIPPVQHKVSDTCTLSIAITIVDTKTGNLLLQEGQDITLDGVAAFAGTGARYAHNCWQTNKCAVTAVKSAQQKDFFSGGEVKFLRLDTLESNISNSTRITDVQRKLAQEGFVMYISNQNIVPVDQAAVNDQQVRDLTSDLVAGKVVVNAPCDGMHNSWSDDSIRRLESLLEERFNL